MNKVAIGACRSGKGVATAEFVAEQLRKGTTVFYGSIDDHGKPRFERVIGVPGFGDGKQLPNG